MSDFSEVAAKVQAAVEQSSESPAPETPAAPEKTERKPLGLPKKEEPVAAEPVENDPPSEESEGEQPEQPQLTEAQQQRQKALEEAQSKGWVPKDQWIEAGKDPDDWVSAKRFMEDHGRIKQWSSLKKDLDRVTKQNEELSAIVKRGFKQQGDQRLQEQMALRDKAIELGDKDAVHKIEQQINKEREAYAVPEPAEPKQIEPEVDNFIKENREWWGVDPMATQMAIAYYDKLEKANPDELKDNLEKTKSYVKRRFPDLFPSDVADATDAAVASHQQTQRRLSSVSAPTGGNAPAKKTKQWSDLPPETRAVADQLVKKKVMTREQYLKQYFG